MENDTIKSQIEEILNTNSDTISEKTLFEILDSAGVSKQDRGRIVGTLQLMKVGNNYSKRPGPTSGINATELHVLDSVGNSITYGPEGGPFRVIVIPTGE